MTSSTISNIKIKNSPVQVFSINTATDLTLDTITIDNSAGDALDSDGDALGHNTDAFDVGSSTGVIINKATVYNQDDCLAVNSGTVSHHRTSIADNSDPVLLRTSRSQMAA